jgi:hypothetical protein
MSSALREIIEGKLTSIYGTYSMIISAFLFFFFPVGGVEVPS